MPNEIINNIKAHFSLRVHSTHIFILQAMFSYTFGLIYSFEL